MKKFLAPVFAVILAAASAAAQDAGGRDLIITDARGDTSRPAPLVVMLHGAGGSGRQLARSTRFDREARRHGLIVVYPSAEGRIWQEGRKGRPATDVSYIVQLIERARKDARVTDGPAILIGHSQGGSVALAVACARPDLVAGLGIVATKEAPGTACPRGRPKPAIFIHGTADPISPHDGRADDSVLGPSFSATDTIEMWKRRNGCTDRVRVTRIDASRRDPTSVVIRSHDRCRAALTQVLILGGGHGWPDGSARPAAAFGPQSGEIDASQVLLDFLAPLVGR